MTKKIAACAALCLFQLGCQKASISLHSPSTTNAQLPASSPSASVGSTPSPTSNSLGNGPVDLTQDLHEQRMLVLINQHRADNGFGSLKIHPVLIQSARWLSQDMAVRNYLSHTDSIGRDSFERMDAFGFELNGWRGENIACGNGGADETYQQWLNSPGHNANMLGPHYTRIGIARAYDPGSQYGWYWTTDFGSD